MLAQKASSPSEFRRPLTRQEIPSNGGGPFSSTEQSCSCAERRQRFLHLSPDFRLLVSPTCRLDRPHDPHYQPDYFDPAASAVARDPASSRRMPWSGLSNGALPSRWRGRPAWIDDRNLQRGRCEHAAALRGCARRRRECQEPGARRRRCPGRPAASQRQMPQSPCSVRRLRPGFWLHSSFVPQSGVGLARHRGPRVSRVTAAV